ncbi:MAG: hypothetical protein R3C24_01685 [Cyanobacteriota/Melainabacteria group bacterium]
MNRDFVLLAARRQSFNLAVLPPDRAEGSLAGMLSILPPVRKKNIENSRDLVFLLDRSGSMHGEKMISAKRACKFLLFSWTRDRFAINAFGMKTTGSRAGSV